jgi:O-antigen ligase
MTVFARFYDEQHGKYAAMTCSISVCISIIKPWLPIIALMVFFGLFGWVEDKRLHRNLYYLLLAGIALWSFRPVFLKALFALPLMKILLIYLAYQLISLAWSPLASLEEYSELLRKSGLSVGLVLILVAILREQQRWWVFAAGFVVMTAVSVLYSLSLGAEVQELSNTRLIGIGRSDNANATGTLYGVVLIFAGWLTCNQMARHFRNCEEQSDTAIQGSQTVTLWTATQYHRYRSQLRGLSLLMLILCWLILLYGLWETQSRGAMVAAAVAHGVLFFRNPRRWHVYILGIMMLFGVVLTAIYAEQIAVLLGRADSYRFMLWEHALNQWQQAPLWGQGYRIPYELTLPYGGVMSHAHSIYVTALLYGGIVGLVLLVWLLFMALNVARKNPSGGGLTLALLVNGLVFGLVDYNLLLVNAGFEWLLFWLPLGFAFVLEYNKQNHHRHCEERSDAAI